MISINLDEQSMDTVMAIVMSVAILILIFIGYPLKRSKKKNISNNPLVFIIIAVSIIITTLAWLFGGYVLVSFLLVDREITGLREQVALGYFSVGLALAILGASFKKRK